MPPSEAQPDDGLGRMAPGPGDPGPAQLLDAARLALDDPAFYNVSQVDFAAPGKHRERTAIVDLDDYTATVIGIPTR